MVYWCWQETSSPPPKKNPLSAPVRVIKEGTDKNKNFGNFADKFKASPGHPIWELQKDQLEENTVGVISHKVC